MAPRQSVSTTQTASHTAAAAVSSSQPTQLPSHLHNPALSASLKIAGVVIFLVLCSLIVLSAKASGKEATDTFNQANKDSTSSLKLHNINLTATGASADLSAGSASASVEASTTSNGDGTSVNVSVNGQAVDIPDSGNYQKTITSPDGSTTSLHVSTSNDGDASNRSHTTTSVNVRSKSTVSGSSSSTSSIRGTGATN
jgi:hypothetical protein